MKYPNPERLAAATASATAAAATAHAETQSGSSRTLWGDAWGRLKKNKLAIAAVVWIIFVAIIALTADLWAQQLLGDPLYASTADMAQNSVQPPSLEHPFGTDVTGRDILCRVVYGSRVSLSVGIVATAISTVIGLVMGAIAAYYGGIWDTIIMRLADIFLAFPYTLFVIAMIAVIGNGIQNVFIAIGILGWPSIARVFRSAILSVKENDYVDAARSMGASDIRIVAPFIPRHGRDAAAAVVGRHDPGGPDLPHHGSVDDGHAWSRHPHHRARLHPAGRRPARCPRCQDEGRVNHG